MSASRLHLLCRILRRPDAEQHDAHSQGPQGVQQLPMSVSSGLFPDVFHTVNEASTRGEGAQHTGMDFTPENFVHAIQEHKRLAKQAQEAEIAQEAGQILRLCVCLLLQDLVQRCLHGGGGIWADMCYERRRAEACVD
jgi:hypothetical protein